ncbi:transmembrane amino acid transporter protein [Teladorsagia circumcincta]|uniref:Transmembrane amino acid transporter protein n=1 Tax=Teladorsagia circumcincta TaxID=45464 RepID=A0A2G9V0H3_TELCI|nr:transmembrane amino acid transporter protein [Teladorsagia circumcincta]
MAAVFVVGDLAGGGMIALPKALVNAGLVPGLILISLCALCSGYTGLQLASNWTMLQKRLDGTFWIIKKSRQKNSTLISKIFEKLNFQSQVFKWGLPFLPKDPSERKQKPQPKEWAMYHGVCRKPYGEMAFRACGQRMRSFIAVMVCLTQFGFATVLILLAAKNTAILLHFFFSIKLGRKRGQRTAKSIEYIRGRRRAAREINSGSKDDATTLSKGGDIKSYKGKDVSYRDFDLRGFFMAYGTMAFAFGGHAVFPTIQNDMRKPRLFSRSVWVAYILIVIYYGTISVMGYSIYGASVGEAIIPSVQLQNICIGDSFPWLHGALLKLKMFTTINSDVNVTISRTEAFQIGASSMSLMTMVMPSIFYLFLYASNIKRKNAINERKILPDSPDNERATLKEYHFTFRRYRSIRCIFALVPKPILVANILSLTFGIIGGLAATGFSVVALTSADVAAPCYIQYIRQGKLIEEQCGDQIPFQFLSFWYSFTAFLAH